MGRTETTRAKVTYSENSRIQFIELEEVGFYGNLLLKPTDKAGIYEAFVEKATYEALAELDELTRKHKEQNGI